MKISVQDWLFRGRGTRPTQVDPVEAVPTYVDPLNNDPTNIPSLVGPSLYWTGVVSNFTPPIHEANHISSMDEMGVTANAQPTINYTSVVDSNAAVGSPNIATGNPDSVRMSSVTRALEERLVVIQDFLLGAP